MKKETWKPVPGFGGHYEASSLGRVRSKDRTVNAKNGSTSTKRGRILKPCVSKLGYLYHCIRWEGQKRGMKVHRLVGLAFGLIEGTEPINHIDGDKLNNRPENLEPTTALENNRHAWKLGLRWDKGSRHYRAKLDVEKVSQIKKRFKGGEGATSLAKEFGVSSTTIYGVVRGKTWRHTNAEHKGAFNG